MAPDIPVRDTADLPRLLDVPTLADYLHVPVSTLYHWRSRGEGPQGLKVGKQVRYREADVASWLNEQTTGKGQA